MYPSLEHRKGRGDPRDVVVEARVVNDMKSLLSEKEFWQLIGHLYAVGSRAGKVASVPLHRGWQPRANFVRSRRRA
jgi:hypothetical protein